jgi:DNA-binding CsgD family transcriptional regulator
MELCTRLRAVAKDCPSQTAVSARGEEYTYSELLTRIDSLSRSLADMGCGRGSRLAFIGESGARLAEMLFALSQLGAELCFSPEGADFAFICAGAEAPPVGEGCTVISEEPAQGSASYKKIMRRVRVFRRENCASGGDTLLRLPDGEGCTSAALAELMQSGGRRTLIDLPVYCRAFAEELCRALGGGTAIMPGAFRAKDWIYAISDEGAERAFLTPASAEAIICDSNYLKGDFSGLREIRLGLAPFKTATLAAMQDCFPPECTVEKSYGFPAPITLLCAPLRDILNVPAALSIGKPVEGECLAAFAGDTLLPDGEEGELRRLCGDAWQPIGARGTVAPDGYVFLARDKLPEGAGNLSLGTAPVPREADVSSGLLSALMGLRSSGSGKELCRAAAELPVRWLGAECAGVSLCRREIIADTSAQTLCRQAESAAETVPLPEEIYSSDGAWTPAAREKRSLTCYPLRAENGELCGGAFLAGVDAEKSETELALVLKFLTGLLETHEMLHINALKSELFRQAAAFSSEGVGISRVAPHPALMFANDIASEQINLGRRDETYGKKLESAQTANMLALAQGETSSSRSFYTRMGDRKLWVDYRAEKVTVDGEDYALCFSNTQDNRSSTRHLESFLTHRETEIVDLLSRGASNKEIAAALEISENTVKYHLSRIYDKMEVRSRTELLSGTFLKNVRSRG